MKVDMFEENGTWCFKDQFNVSWNTGLSIGSLSPLEVAVVDDKGKLKQIIKLKAAGFTADEILELMEKLQ